MDEIVDPFAEAQAEEAEERKLKAVRAQGRDAAILRGRLHGEHEASSRGERGTEREQRIARAMAYAAWEFDGKPLGTSRYQEEFGIGILGALTSALRGGPDPKKGK